MSPKKSGTNPCFSVSFPMGKETNLSDKVKPLQYRHLVD